MAQWMVAMKQAAQGCDYMIDCGVRCETFKAESLEEAQQKAKECWFGEDYGEEEGWELPYHNGEVELSHMYLCLVVEPCPIEQWAAEVEEKRQELRQAEVERQEREQLARLQAKYG